MVSIRLRRFWVGMCGWAVALSVVPAGAVQLAAVIEAKGGGAVAGGSFRNGYRLAIDEINAAGGILGEQITLNEIEIDTNADAVKAATVKAIAAQPFAILGPVFSGLTIASLSVARDAGIPQFSGGEAASISKQFPLTLYRTSMSQRASLPRLGSFVAYALQAKKISLLWVDNEFGRDGRDTLVQTMQRFGGSVPVSIGVKPGTQQFAGAIDKILASDTEALVVYMNESESAALLKELRARGYKKPIVGDGPLVAGKVIADAGPAAEGVYAHIAVTAEAPNARVRAFVERYKRRFDSQPDHNSIKGYFAVQVIKYAAELNKEKRFDRTAFNQAMSTLRIEATQSNAMLNAATYYIYGDMNRESYLATVKNGALVVLATFPMTDGSTVELINGKSVGLNSKEGRLALVHQ